MKKLSDLSTSGGVVLGDSLSQPSGARRTVQFLIERECPEPFDEPTNLREYPTPVFVEWPPVMTVVHPCSSPRFYRLTPSERWRLGYGASKYNMYVCEHMGRIIE